VRELAPKATDEQIRRSSLSIIGQIVFYHHCRPAIDKMYPDVCYTRQEIDQLAEHVTTFSLAALKSIHEEKNNQVQS